MHLTLHGWGLRSGIFLKRRVLLACASTIGSAYLHDKAEADNIRSSEPPVTGLSPYQGWQTGRKRREIPALKSLRGAKLIGVFLYIKGPCDCKGHFSGTNTATPVAKWEGRRPAEQSEAARGGQASAISKWFRFLGEKSGSII